MKKINFYRATIIFLFFSCFTVFASQVKTNYYVKNIKIENAATKTVEELQCFGEKYLCIFYIDPDKQHQNAIFEDDLSKAQIGLDKLCIIPVINCKDTWMPDFAIRSAVHKRAIDPKTEGAPIYLDYENTLSKSWQLGDCDNSYSIILINEKGKIDYICKHKMSKEEREEALNIMRKNVKRLRKKK